MEKSFLTMRYYETYYYANIVHNVLDDPFPYIRHVHSWYEDREAVFLRPFPKFSILHDFAAHVISMLIDEYDGAEALGRLASNRHAELWIDRAFRDHGTSTEGFRSWLAEKGVALDDADEDDIREYYSELNLSGQFGDLIDHLVNEVFYVLFNNRSLLAKLNRLVANVVCELEPDGIGDEEGPGLAGPGRLKRVPIPSWVKKAVFHREKGLCAACSIDVGGVLTSQTDPHYDHIVPLAQHGVNDVTNIQLLCGTCNLKKGRNLLPPSDRYQTWY